ncbi:MAG: SUMF1/EgtB/PvdO family nonheme iron enzyme [Gemmataceae bacterium]|nr:SUMF1/EgtB/PvdO family nonheme iron enzyme [Gemmataceae bacterium]
MSDTRAALLHALRSDPADSLAWLALADWLEEQDDAAGELVRLRLRLREPLPARTRRDLVKRQAELLAAGVLPCVPDLVNSAGMEFALIQPGTFVMGTPEDEEGRYDDEGPAHAVTITRPFWMGRHTVTQAQFRARMGRNPSCFSPDGDGAAAVAGLDHGTLPAERVTWHEAARFCARLSALGPEKKAGRVYRLPTEAEWEYACRAGSAGPFACGEELTSALANFDGTRPYGTRKKGKHLQRTSPVGSYPPNAWGLYDMHGNVWEWCHDWFDRDYYAISPASDPPGPATGEEKVLRGGSYYYIGSSCRAAIRLDREPDARSNLDGFRVVLEWSPG